MTSLNRSLHRLATLKSASLLQDLAKVAKMVTVWATGSDAEFADLSDGDWLKNANAFEQAFKKLVEQESMDALKAADDDSFRGFDMRHVKDTYESEYLRRGYDPQDSYIVNLDYAYDAVALAHLEVLVEVKDADLWKVVELLFPDTKLDKTKIMSRLELVPQFGRALEAIVKEMRLDDILERTPAIQKSLAKTAENLLPEDAEVEPAIGKIAYTAIEQGTKISIGWERALFTWSLKCSIPFESEFEVDDEDAQAVAKEKDGPDYGAFENTSDWDDHHSLD